MGSFREEVIFFFLIVMLIFNYIFFFKKYRKNKAVELIENKLKKN
jgi:hypothetical protein